MNGQLVYRSLRQLSAWALDGFYSDVHVSGHENVPATGPVVLLPCHHNEIMDIAALSVTVPHGRPIRFWAKSSMFANPVLRAVMASSGSIPVQRIPNSIGAAGTPGAPPDARFALLRETFRALDAGEVVGVFPEGTSYTAPQIAQVKEGAAWVALEYARWQLQHAAAGAQGKSKKLTLVPVGIVYSDKTRFKSRVFVRFGEPIELEQYTRRHLASADPRVEVQSLTSEIEARLFRLTVNTTTWDHFFAGSIARDIASDEIDTADSDTFIRDSQSYLNQLAARNDTEMVESLVKYYTLLHYTAISHGTLATLYREDDYPTRYQGLVVFVRQLARSIAHPPSIAFLPVGLVHLPAYIAGTLAGKYLANPKEPETIAERKAVCAGLAFFAASASIGMKAYTFLSEAVTSVVQRGTLRSLSDQSTTASALTYIGRAQIAPSFCKVLGMATAVVCTTWILFRWHRALVPWNYKQLQRTSAAWTIFTATWLPASAALTSAQLASVRRPPLPAPNPFIKRRGGASAAAERAPAARDCGSRGLPSARLLVGHLLAARADAEAAVRRVFGGVRHPARAQRLDSPHAPIS